MTKLQQFSAVAQVSSLEEPAFILDPETFVILAANSACEGVVGQPSFRWVGRSLLTLLEETAREDFKSFVQLSQRPGMSGIETRWNLMGHLMDLRATPYQLSLKQDVLQVVIRSRR